MKHLSFISFCIFIPFFTVVFALVYRGVILMRLDHAGKIQSASLISSAEPEPEPELLPGTQPPSGTEVGNVSMAA